METELSTLKTQLLQAESKQQVNAKREADLLVSVENLKQEVKQYKENADDDNTTNAGNQPIEFLYLENFYFVEGFQCFSIKAVYFLKESLLSMKKSMLFSKKISNQKLPSICEGLFSLNFALYHFCHIWHS